MQKVSFSDAPCSIARSLNAVGEWWSILILRNAFMGQSRFDEFSKSLGIAPNMLTRRLKGLVDAGLLEKREYCARPPRFEYILTDAGRDFMPVLASLVEWGNKHSSPDGVDTVLVDKLSFKPRKAAVVDSDTGEALSWENTTIGAGPAARRSKRKFFEALNLPIVDQL